MAIRMGRRRGVFGVGWVFRNGCFCSRALGEAEGLPVRVVEVLGEGVEGSDLGQAGELAVEQAFDRGEADQDAGSGFDGVGEGLQIALDQGRCIGEAGLFAQGRHANLHQFVVAQLFCLHFECLWMSFEGKVGALPVIFTVPNYSLCSKKT